MENAAAASIRSFKEFIYLNNTKHPLSSIIEVDLRVEWPKLAVITPHIRLHPKPAKRDEPEGGTRAL